MWDVTARAASHLGHADPAVTLRVYAHLMSNDDAKLARQVGSLFG